MSLVEWQTQLSQALLLSDSPPWCELSSLQGIEGQRLGLYQTLIAHTVQECLQSIYPLTYRLISRNGQVLEAWQAVVESYRRTYPNPSYKLMGAVENFPAFLAEQPQWMARYPFIDELALYEWLEMWVMNLPDTQPQLPLSNLIPEISLFEQYAPIWNDAQVLQRFRFNIPEIIQALQSTPDVVSLGQVEAKAIEVLIYREPSSLNVRFFVLNGMVSLLYQLSLQQPTCSYAGLLAQLHVEVPALQALSMDVIEAQAARLFQNCLEIGILLGSTALSLKSPSIK